VRGFHIPALNAFTLGLEEISRAVSNTCSSVSALQGPAMTKGSPDLKNRVSGSFKG
jgi:hypothetical protein